MVLSGRDLPRGSRCTRVAMAGVLTRRAILQLQSFWPVNGWQLHQPVEYSLAEFFRIHSRPRSIATLRIMLDPFSLEPGL